MKRALKRSEVVQERELMNKNREEHKTSCHDDEVFSGVVCLKKISCPFGFEFPDGGHSIACACPSKASYNKESQKCVCHDSNEFIDKTGQCRLKQCLHGQIYQENECQCLDPSKAFALEENESTFICKELAQMNRLYPLQDRNSFYCPQNTLLKEAKKKFFQCAPNLSK